MLLWTCTQSAGILLFGSSIQEDAAVGHHLWNSTSKARAAACRACRYGHAKWIVLLITISVTKFEMAEFCMQKILVPEDKIERSIFIVIMHVACCCTGEYMIGTSLTRSIYFGHVWCVVQNKHHTLMLLQ